MTNENKKQKRFYKDSEVVWIVELKKEGKVKSINKEDLTMTVTYKDGNETKEHTDKMWGFDKLKYSAKEKLVKSTGGNKIDEAIKLINNIFYPQVYFAKVREDAIIPSKRDEDAGYDIYANLEAYPNKLEDGTVYYEALCPVLTTTLVPTGLAVAMPNTHYLNLKHERGSTGVQSMSVLAGVVDSGFRNEMFIALTPLRKSVVISSLVDKVEEDEKYIYYPLSKAIAQGTVDLVPKATVSEITYDKLQDIESERGKTMLGQSGK